MTPRLLITGILAVALAVGMFVPWDSAPWNKTCTDVKIAASGQAYCTDYPHEAGGTGPR